MYIKINLIIIEELFLFYWTEPNNEIFSMDISNAGDTLATAGYDATLRIYDTCTEKVINTKLLN